MYNLKDDEHGIFGWTSLADSATETDCTASNAVLALADNTSLTKEQLIQELLALNIPEGTMARTLLVRYVENLQAS